ncbi:MAG: hypothetical protein KF760_10170 [Candidatus Eremiobacteraeota bacterium]|nr:hypothetical protein [Candidatus Eremiobacteraeota bacterium]MCW5867703.1 hypothetical protein [Candidatus Eremiobacteraeota bacterium]
MTQRLFLVLLLLIPCLASAQNWQLKPGSGYGPILLNQSQAEAEAALGTPIDSKTSESDPESSLKSYKGDIILLINGQKKVLGITIRAAGAKMAGGLGIGSSVSQVQSALGPGLRRGPQQVAYPNGIGFAYDASGKVERVFIFKAEAQSALQGDRLIVAGKRCGDLKVGMTLAEVESAWGAAPKKDGKNHSWPDKFVSLLVDNGQVLAITITTGDYISPKGLKAGSSKAEVLKVYGKAPDTTGGNLIYPRRGIAFYLAGDSVSTIQVFAPIK